jgi:2'-5' RNA ligase
VIQADEYAIIYLLPEPARSYHLDLWSKVETKFQLTGRTEPKAPPHITLKYSFEAENLMEVERVLAAFAATSRQTPWSIRGYNHFITPDNYVIFLEVIPTTAVRAAHTDLLAHLRPIPWLRWNLYDNVDLHYHATIAHRGLTNANFVAAWEFVSSQPPPDFDLHFDNLALLKINDEIDTVYNTFYMGGMSH